MTRQVKVTIVTSEFQGFHEKSEQAYRLIDKEMENNHQQSQSIHVMDGIDGTDSEGGQCQRHEHTMEENKQANFDGSFVLRLLRYSDFTFSFLRYCLDLVLENAY